MRKFYGMLWLLCGVFAFAACSDDEEENGDQGKPLDPSTFRRVEKIVEIEDGRDTYQYVYIYDSEGRLMKMKETDSHGQMYTDSIVYKNDIITSYAFQDSMIFSLKDERAESFLDYENGVCIDKYICNYSGDYLTKVVSTTDDNKKFTETLTWIEGSISKYDISSDLISGIETVVLEYSGNYENKASVDMVYWLGGYIFSTNMDGGFKLNICGQRSKYLPTKLTVTGKDEDNVSYKDVYSLKYTTDKGYVTKIEVTDEEDVVVDKFEIYYKD